MKLLNITILLFLFFNSCEFAPGSYPNAEIYEFNTTEEQLINAIEEFKINNPHFAVPENLRLIDGRSKDKLDHWYHVWFYYEKENQIIYTWTRKNKIALVSINSGTVLGNWKDINKDFSSSENKKQKKKFEERILNKIRVNLNKCDCLIQSSDRKISDEELDVLGLKLTEKDNYFILSHFSKKELEELIKKNSSCPYLFIAVSINNEHITQLSVTSLNHVDEEYYNSLFSRLINKIADFSFIDAEHSNYSFRVSLIDCK
jgi:hypothetical protein